jgi:AcrR family transcriptional regulator
MNSPGLRERKKQRTRWAIQEHALRLIAEQGYDATTVDQIAAAAEISPSTFFRYFPTKEDLVIQDRFDDLVVEGIRAAPAELSPIAAIRYVVAHAFGTMSLEEEAQVRQRERLVISVPALRARSFENLLSTMDLLRSVLAERVKRPADDLPMRAFAGALVGAMIGMLEVWLDAPAESRLADLVDTVLAQMEQGFPI